MRVGRSVLAGLAIVLTIGCTTTVTGGVAHTPSDGGPARTAHDSAATADIRERYAGYTVERAQQEGYVRDAFCLDALSFGRAGSAGAMGFHATDERLLRGPIAADKPQAIMFDAQGRVLGVEYEITADAVREAPTLFGQTFNKMPPHAGVHHEHYALHVWFMHNPAGQFADFNPMVSCPPGSTPQGSTSHPVSPSPGVQPQAPSLTGPGTEVDMEEHGH